MAASVTKSSPNRNPNSRSSEINNSMRRSFSGNPFAKPSIATKQKGFNSVTPANSPSDFPRRHSISRESIPSSLCEDKENGKEQELKRARSRSPSVLKGTKNFMSPTISATSKVTASPKKKILAEKNESLCSSFPSSEGKPLSNLVGFSDVLEFIDAKPQTDSNNYYAVAEFEHKGTDFRAPLIPKASGFDPKVVQCTPKSGSRLRRSTQAVEEECVNLDRSPIGSNPCPSRDILAPLDADMHPYDPETNFTSPRPQFLCYRPNPRIEVYLSRERQGEGLEDNFISESSSDSGFTEETETQSEERQGEGLENNFISESSPDAGFTEEAETQSEDSHKYSEDVSSGGMLKEVVFGQMMKEEISGEMVQDAEVSIEMVQPKEEEVLYVSESNPISSSSAHMSKGTVDGKRVTKLHFFRRPKTVAFLLTLLVACLSVSVTDSPVVGLVLKDSSYSNFYVPPEFSAYLTVHLDGLAQNFRLWHAKSMYYLSELVSNLRVHRFGTLKYSNLTALYDDQYLVDGHLLFNQHYSGAKNEFQSIVLESELTVGLERVVETEKLEEMCHPEIEVDEIDGYGDLESEVYDEQEHEKVEVHDIPAAEVHSDLLAEQDGLEHSVHDNSENVAAEHSTPEVEEVCFRPPGEASETNNLDTETAQEKIDAAASHKETNSESGMAQEQIDAAASHMGTNLESGMTQEKIEAAASHMETNFESGMSSREHSEVPDTLSELLKTEDHQGENDLQSYESEIKSTEADESPERPELDSSSEGRQTMDLNWLRDEVSELNAIGIALLLLALIAATTFFVYKRKENSVVSSINTPALNLAAPADQQLLTKKFDISPESVSASVEHNFYERLSSCNLLTEADLDDESCPSEMSSFQISSSYSKKGVDDSSEAQSQDRKPKKNYKRESLASSDDYSVGSVSYGSFTTYEKISAKRGNGEATPVRRSSRIRKQVTSP